MNYATFRKRYRVGLICIESCNWWYPDNIDDLINLLQRVKKDMQ